MKDAIKKNFGKHMYTMFLKILIHSTKIQDISAFNSDNKLTITTQKHLREGKLRFHTTRVLLS